MKQNFALCLAVLIILSFSFLACSDDQEAPNGISSGAASDSSQSPASSSPTSSSSPSSSDSSSQGAITPYISEYVEGSGNNKYIELFNPGLSAINLSGWSLKQYNNGVTSPSYSLSLSGTIQPGACFVIRRDPEGEWSGTADQSDSGSTMNYNGNDPIGLFNGSTLIDLVGTPGNSSSDLENMTLIRKPGHGAKTVWDLGDWYRHPADTLSFLGAHDPLTESAIPGPEPETLPVEYPLGAPGSKLYISEYFAGDGNDKYIELYNAGSSTVGLANYRLVRIDVDPSGQTNLAKSWCIQLKGELYGGNVLMLINEGFSPDRLTTVDGINTVESLDQYGATRKFLESAAFYPKAVCFFGGNDPVYLVKDDQVIDAVGYPATSEGWGKDKVMIRNQGGLGNPVWDTNEWEITATMTGNPKSYVDGSDWNAGWHQP